MTTRLLAQAFEKASELLQELAGEARWDQTLAESGEALDKMAEQALKEHRASRTKKMGFDEL